LQNKSTKKHGNRAGWAGSGFGLGQFDSVRLSGHGSSRVRSGQVPGLLVSGRFRFRDLSGRVGSVIGSSNVGSFWISNRIR
jgi:hypothetical protein